VWWKTKRFTSKFIFSRIKKRRKPKVKIVTLQRCEVKKNRYSFYENLKSPHVPLRQHTREWFFFPSIFFGNDRATQETLHKEAFAHDENMIWWWSEGKYCDDSNHLVELKRGSSHRVDLCWPVDVVTSVTRTNSGHVCVKPIMSVMSIFPVNRGPKIPTVRVFPLRWFHLLQ
jgi:hypothetical protein